MRQDYGRAGFIRPQWVFLVGNYTGKWGISYSPFLIFQGGRPYNLTTPYDLTGDSFFNSRPSYAGASANPNDVVDTSFGSLNTIPQPGESLVPADLGNSPNGFAMNLRISRSFGVGPGLRKPPVRDQAEDLVVLGEAGLREVVEAVVGVVVAAVEEGLVEAALGVVASEEACAAEAVVVRAAEWEIPAASTRSISARRR